MRRSCRVVVLALAGMLGGCVSLAPLGTRNDGLDIGKVFFVGGAGPIGNVVGTFDVPEGLRRGGYRGAVEVFGWQSVVGGTLRDQMDRDRNLREARKLAEKIAGYQDAFPGRPVHIIALSAGTGVAVWALESLPPGHRVQSVALLSSSLSREYDLTTALRAVSGRVYSFYSPADPVLGVFMRGVGSVDRETWVGEAAGLRGLALPVGAGPETRRLYAERVRNMPHQLEYARYGYVGFHADSVASEFIAHIVTPLLISGRLPDDIPATAMELVPGSDGGHADAAPPTAAQSAPTPG
ncbi:MAG: hypothetical protein IPM13_04270 [Phycisphaerales bacterium]|nr:hypothetical protein [Phycisphaerales bacterium]